MTENIQIAVRRAVLRLLRPLVRILLKHGMAYGSFAELARKAYVDEGFRHVAKSGRRASISSVSALTGLTRKETKRLAELDITDESAGDQRYNRAIRVVSGWLADRRFTDKQGKPRPLPLDGDNSFATLVRDYSGDIPPVAMLTILESSATVEQVDGQVLLRERAYLPSHTPVERIDILGKDVAELISSINHNISSAGELRVFQRKVSNPAVREDALTAFRKLSNQKSQELLEDYLKWLSEHEVDTEDPDGPPARYVAVGIFYYDDTLEENGP